MKKRFSPLMPAKTPSASVGAAPATTPTRTNRRGSFHAQASAPGPPPDTPTMPNRPSCKQSARAAASSAQSNRVRRDDAKTGRDRVTGQESPGEPRSRKAVQEQDRFPFWIAVLGKREQDHRPVAQHVVAFAERRGQQPVRQRERHLPPLDDVCVGRSYLVASVSRVLANRLSLRKIFQP